MNGHHLEDGQRSNGIFRKLLYVGGALLVLFCLSAMPLPGPLSRARESWWQHAAERRAKVESYEAHGWPDDNSHAASADSVVIDEKNGTSNFSPTQCDSGQRRMFYGVIVTDPGQPELSARIVLPESGDPHVALQRRGKQDLVFKRQSCSVWDVSIEQTNSFYNQVQNLQGHAYFDCTKDAVHVTGHVELRACH
ncbi:hypothetical protein [Acidicapsa ligni]|uniref:hypothetical protein n=1 Tax=Acidicapsa ligni TaxID=542300 RepID=UPI0021E0C3CC|nr:hypothetical protein [Acidicapsa ligni]